MLKREKSDSEQVASRHVPGAFYGLLALGAVSGCAAYAAVVLYSASWPEAAALRVAFEWQPRAYTAAEFWGLRQGLLLLTLGASFGLAFPAARREAAALRWELAQVGRGLRQSWQQLRPGQRHGALAGLAALTAVRVYYSCTLQAYDDATTYELFVRESWLAANAAYPFPNNHVLSSALDRLFYLLDTGFWWSIRLPVLLTSTLATSLWFLGLLRRTSFGVAALAVGLFCLILESLYYAGVGRGYWLLVGLGAVGFFALLALCAQTPGRQRVAALGLVLSGVLGLYTVPTHLLFLVPAYGWWAVATLSARGRRAGPSLARLVALGALTGVGAVLLYAPLLLISGPDLVVHNRYVSARSSAEFWSALVANFCQPYQLLVWTPLTLLALAGLWVLLRQAQAGRLPPGPATWVRQLGPASAWLMLTPYLLSVVQRSYPPERTLFYKAQYTCLLVALGADWAVRRGFPWCRQLLAGGLVAFAALQLGRVEKQEAMWRVSMSRARAQPAVEWLLRQVPGPILAPEPAQRFSLRFYSRGVLAAPPWQLDAMPRSGVHYRYVLTEPGLAPTLNGQLLRKAPAERGPVFDIFTGQ